MPLKHKTYSILHIVNLVAAMTGIWAGPIMSIALALNKSSIPEAIYLYTQVFAWIWHLWSYGPFILFCLILEQYRPYK